MIEVDIDLAEIPKLQRRMLPLPLKEFRAKHQTLNQAITSVYLSGGYTMKEIGAYFGIGYFMMSKIVWNSRFKT